MPSGRWEIPVLLMGLLAASLAAAQDTRELALAQPLPAAAAAAPVKMAQPAALPAAPSAHAGFWDRRNIVLASVMGAATAADFAATHRNLSRGGEERNPVARVFTGSTGGRVAYFAGSAAGTIGLSYIFHRTNHHKLERATLMVGIGCSAQGAAYSFTHD